MREELIAGLNRGLVQRSPPLLIVMSIPVQALRDGPRFCPIQAPFEGPDDTIGRLKGKFSFPAIHPPLVKRRQHSGELLF